MKLASTITKQAVFFWLCFFTFATPQAQSAEFEGRVGGFHPQSKLFRKMYGTIIPSYQLEADWKLLNSIKMWGNITYLNRSGHSVPLETPTHLQMLPISAGFAYVTFFPRAFEFSIGAGACYTWLKETNTSGFIPPSNIIRLWGGIAKISLTKKIRWFVISAFADYLLQETALKNPTENTCVDLSGLFFGCGIGGFY